MSMFEFEENSYSVFFNGCPLQLQPLSFALLKALAESEQEIVSSGALIEKVWGSTPISPETLKQRVFVLRKAIDESDMQGLSIKSVRGKGYRLFVERQTEVDSVVSVKPRKLALVAGVTLAFVSVFSYFVFFANNQFSTNNRVVLWANMDSHKMPLGAESAYEEWQSMLSSKTDQGELQLVYSKRMGAKSISDQARENMAGVISNFELVNVGDTPSIRLSIVEPTTAAVLRSDIVPLGERTRLESKMQSHLNAIANLVFSRAICLSNKQRKNPASPVWAELKRIANRA